MISLIISVILRLIHNHPVKTGGGNQSTWRKPPPNFKSLATSIIRSATSIKKDSLERNIFTRWYSQAVRHIVGLREVGTVIS